MVHSEKNLQKKKKDYSGRQSHKHYLEHFLQPYRPAII